MISYLKSRKPLELEKFIVPPLNADIRHTLLLNQRPKMEKEPIVPKNFSWASSDDDDSAEVKFKKKLIHKVPNQLACGSCWAVSVASAVSDCLVVGDVIRQHPDISPTFCLACFPQHQCNGGMPAKLALDIMNYGVADNTCVDYSWCTNVRGCDVSMGPIFPDALNSRIPPCACSKRYNGKLYFLDKGSVVTISVTPSRPVPEFRYTVKDHIRKYGPVVGGLLVLENFLSGIFTESNGGVYFDRADYSRTGKKLFFDNSINHSRNSKGFHAVTVVGWGIAEGIQYDNDKVGDVPYWHCRNSWGTGWGDKGFFKIAMYPFNKIAQLDKVVNVNIGGEPGEIGGLILFTATKPRDLIIAPSTALN